MPDSRSDSTFFTARAVFDGSTMRPGHGVLVAGGRVVDVVPTAAAPAGATVHDLGDRFVVPGFVDAHTHVTIRPGAGDQHGQLAKPAVWQAIRGAPNLRRMLASGVTTARIMTEAHDIDYEFRDAIAKGEVAGPRLLVAGPGPSPPAGHRRARCWLPRRLRGTPGRPARRHRGAVRRVPSVYVDGHEVVTSSGEVRPLARTTEVVAA